MAQHDALAADGHGGPGIRAPLIPMLMVLLLVAFVGALGGIIAGYLTRYGPSGSHPVPWAYTGNGALEVLIYCPLVMLTGWVILPVWLRGYKRRALTAGSFAILGGLLAGLVNEVGVVGQFPDGGHTRLVFGVLLNVAVSVLALSLGLRLVNRLPAMPFWSLTSTGFLALLTASVGAFGELKGGWHWLSLSQSLLVALTIIFPLLVATWHDHTRLAVQRIVLTVNFLTVPFACAGGLALGSGMVQLVAPSG